MVRSRARKGLFATTVTHHDDVVDVVREMMESRLSTTDPSRRKD